MIVTTGLSCVPHFVVDVCLSSPRNYFLCNDDDDVRSINVFHTFSRSKKTVYFWHLSLLKKKKSYERRKSIMQIH